MSRGEGLNKEENLRMIYCDISFIYYQSLHQGSNRLLGFKYLLKPDYGRIFENDIN